MTIRLIVAADEPALFFSSVEDAEGYLEAIDVENGVYTAAYGPGGEPYRISIEGDNVVISSTGGPPQPDKLKALLLLYLGDRGSPTDELPLLLERCQSPIASARKGGSFLVRDIVVTAAVLVAFAFAAWWLSGFFY
jgi:hypothetical protein